MRPSWYLEPARKRHCQYGNDHLREDEAETLLERDPANVFDRARARVTAGLANEVEAVNQYA